MEQKIISFEAKLIFTFCYIVVLMAALAPYPTTVLLNHQPIDGDTIRVLHTTYEFDNDGVVSYLHVPVHIGESLSQTAENLAIVSPASTVSTILY